MIAHQLMIEINENFDDVNNRIMYCYNKMVGKLKSQIIIRRIKTYSTS